MTLITEIKSSEWSISLQGVGEIVQGIADINQCLKIILFTRKGEDPLRPEFGCGIFDYIDQPINKLPIMKKSIIDAVKLWEPRVELTKITPKINADNSVTFSIFWKLSASVDTGQIDVTYGIA